MKIELNEKERATVAEALKFWLNPVGYMAAKGHRLPPELSQREARLLLGRMGLQ